MPRNLIKTLHRAYPRCLNLLTPEWLEINKRSGKVATGFCYIGAEAAYHLLGGKQAGYKPNYAVYYHKQQRRTHCWLTKGNQIIDPTASQYLGKPPYHLGKAGGFLTKEPSSRARKLLKEYKRLCNGYH